MIKFLDDGEKIANIFFNILLFAIICAISVMLFLTITANGKVTHCYIDSTIIGYKIVGHRDWRPDAVMGSSDNPEELRAIMDKVCPK